MAADWYDKLTIGELIGRATDHWPNREALCWDGARRWSFVELRDEVDSAARALIAAGVAAGDHVALWLGNQPEYVFLFFAIIKIGAVLVPINTRFRKRDMGYVVVQSDATTLIAANEAHGVDYFAMIEELLPDLGSATSGRLAIDAAPRLERVILIGDQRRAGTLDWAELRRAGTRVSDADLQRRSAAVGSDGIAYIMYTSGTTGFPKGAMHRHNVIRNVADNASRFGVTPSDTILNYLPLFHAFGIYRAMLLSAATGARHVLMSRFDAGEALRLIEAERVTVINGFDTHYKDLLEHPSRELRDLSSLRFGILPAGALSTEPIARRAQSIVRTMTAFGMTEIGVGAAGSFLATDEETRVTTSGWPLPGYEMRIIDPVSGAERPAGEIGEICVRGYQVMQGYYKRPEDTARAIDTDDWFHTGDSGLLRADGCLRFLGRYKDQLRVGGENVDPSEVENLLLADPRINHVAVVGVPDPRLMEVPVAFVIRERRAELTEADVITRCRERIASFKVPRHVIFVDAFPMTDSGKIQKYKLREDASRRLKKGE